MTHKCVMKNDHYSTSASALVTVNPNLFRVLTCRKLHNRKTAVYTCSRVNQEISKTGTLSHGITEVAISTKLQIQQN